MVWAAWASSAAAVVTSVALWHIGRAWDDGSRAGEQWHMAVTRDDFSSSTPSGLGAGRPGDGLGTLRRPRAWTRESVGSQGRASASIVEQ
jgi:hypothetical protein